MLLVDYDAKALHTIRDALIRRNESGYILTGADVAAAAPTGGRPPMSLESSVPGVFAVGDVRANSVKRVASAVGEGSVAIRYVHTYLAETIAAEGRSAD